MVGYFRKNDLVERYKTLTIPLHNYSEKLKNDKTNNIFQGFALVHNKIVSCTETLEYYYKKWDNLLLQNPNLPDDTIRREIFGRLTLVTSECFVSVFSAIEYIMKEIVKNIQTSEFENIRRKLQNYERIYLENIIKKSMHGKWITDEELPRWIALITLRNIFVHNNGISDTDKLYQPIKRLFTVFEKDKMIESKYDIFFVLTEMIVNLYESWTKKIQNEYTH